MRYLSICSGIEAASVAWHPLGWQPVAFAEIDKFPSALLAHHYPAVPNLGDFTKATNEHGTIDVLVGGTPCQDFSVAGLRAGLDGNRGQLTIEFTKLAGRLRPKWLVWENVPGVLSVDGGRAFGMFLGLLGQLGYGFAYRVLDAQYFGVPQRRRRVFVVGHLGDWRRAAAVLFERHSLSGHPAPSRKAGKGIAHDVAPCIGASGRGFERPGETRGQDPVIATYVPEIVSQAMSSKWSKGSSGPAGDECANLIAHSLRADGFDASEDGTGRGTPLVPITFNARQDPDSGLVTHPVDTDGHSLAVAISGRARGDDGRGYSRPEHLNMDVASTLDGVKVDRVLGPSMAVRRLTPRECERLQGFPDDYTLIPWRGKMAPDGPRYKALGNSMAVPVMRWIGERIQKVEAL